MPFSRFRSLCVLVVVFLLSSCEAILTQNPAEHFVDGKIPKGAFRFANQVWDMPSVEKVLARLAMDAKNPRLVRVGVMDNGVDIGHPDLIDQIDFGTDGKRITSAGFDVMGGDRFPSPQIVRFEYFAFGAEGLEGGKIKGAPDDPLKKIAEYDKAFLDQFIPKLQANPALKGTIWSKYTKECFSLYGAHTYANMKFDLKSYQNMKKESPERLTHLKWKPKAGSTLNEIQGELETDYRVIFEDFRIGSQGYPIIRGGDNIAQMNIDPRFGHKSYGWAECFHGFGKGRFDI